MDGHRTALLRNVQAHLPTLQDEHPYYASQKQCPPLVRGVCKRVYANMCFSAKPLSSAAVVIRMQRQAAIREELDTLPRSTLTEQQIRL